MKRASVSAAALVAVCIGFAGSAKADNLNSGIHIGNTSYLAATFLPLNGTAKTLNFDSPSAGLVQITFNAKCNVSGPSDSYTDLDVFVDGVAVDPTNGAFDVFCSQYSGLNRSTLTVAKSLAAGAHALRIRAATYNSATSAFIGDSTTVVSR